MGLHFHDSMHGETPFALRGALLIYAGAAGALATAHDVVKGPDGRVTLMQGEPLSREVAESLGRGLQGHSPTRAVFPPQLLAWDGRRMAWWAPARRRRIWFSTHTPKRPEFDRFSRTEILHPPLVFVTDPGKLAVYALAENERPEPNTILQQAPYFNVYDDGSVCAGSVPFPRNADLSDLQRWEEVWYDSEGTHQTCSVICEHPGGYLGLLKALERRKTFPSEVLIPAGGTLLDAINREGRALSDAPVTAATMAAQAGRVTQ